MIKFEYLKEAPSLTIKINGKILKLPDSVSTTPFNFSDEVLIFHFHRRDNGPENNIVAVNKKGEIIWKFNEGNYLRAKHRFTTPWFDEQGDIFVRNMGGKKYQIDSKTGEVISSEFSNMDFEYKDDQIRIGHKQVKIQQKIKKATSWQGEVLLVFYGASEITAFGEYLLAFDSKGEQLWSISHHDLNDKFVLHDGGQRIRLMTSEYTYDFDPRTGKITNKIYAR